ncbi:MAG: helix-turn-helix domain-containing protein [Rickettsiales bacterium]|nr:helix-turn-helix domain-containing protein [Rickettsiales bacterium]
MGFTAILLDERQVAACLQISISKLRADRRNEKGLPFIKIGKSVRYRPQDIELFLKKHAHKHKEQK